MYLKFGNRFVLTPARGQTLRDTVGDNIPLNSCMINGQFAQDWEFYRPQDHDVILFVEKPGYVPGLWESIIATIISQAISAALQMILAPKPKQPNKPKNEAQRVGVSGLDNTVEEGTPACVIYGEKRVWPHVIGSRTNVSDDGRHMTFEVLGFCGDTGGDGYEDCSDVEINDVKLANYAGASFEFRTGTDGQSIVKGFENVEQVFAPTTQTIPHQVEIQSIEIKGSPSGGTFALTVPTFGTTSALAHNVSAGALQTAFRAISGLASVTVAELGTSPNRLFSVAFDGTSGDIAKMTVADSLTPKKASVTVDTIQKGNIGSGPPIVYSTRSPVNEVTMIFSVPGMFTAASEKAYVQIKIERKKSSEGAGSWVQIDGDPEKTAAEGGGPYPLFWRDRSLSALWKPFRHELPTLDSWDFRYSLIKTTSRGGPPSLFNVQETQYTSRNYPGSALLCIRGISSNAIQSLASMRWSAKWKGKRCKVWNGSSFTTQWTDKRMWINRDVMTHPKVGLGHRIPESLHDDDAALAIQNFFDELVAAEGGGTERRDICDLLINDPRPGLNYISEDILGEAACGMIPSGRKLKPIVRKAKTPNLLWTYPGNILDDEGGPVKTRLALPSKSINTLRGTFSDRTQSDKTAVVEEQIAGTPATDVRPDSYQFDSVSRRSQVHRQLNQLLKEAQIIERRTWLASAAGQVIEPGDVDYFSDDKVKNLRGFQGRLPAGSTTTVVELPRIVELESGKTYEIIVRHQGGTEETEEVANIVEKRTVLTGAGKWGRVTVTSAFATAPAEGDIWALGEQDVAIIEVVHESVTMTEEGNFRIVSALYDPAVYDVSAPATSPGSRSIGSVGATPPIPLADAQITQQLVQNADGSFAVNLLMDVTPGLHRIAGKATAGAAGSITLAAASPAIDDYFNTAKIKLIAGTGAGQERRLLDYVGATKLATPDTNFSPAPNGTTEYEITFETFGNFRGFKVESARDSASGFVLAGAVDGTHFEINGKEQGLTEHYRFTPFSTDGTENLSARWVKSVVTGGDTSAPTAPSSVAVSSHLKTVTVEISKTRPTEPDFAGFEVEYYRTSIGGTLLKSVLIPSERDDIKTGSVVRRHSETFDESYGNVVIARARSIDDTKNESGWTNAASGTTITEAQAEDIDPTVISSFVEFTNAAQINYSDQDPPTELAAVTITTEGQNLFLIASAFIVHDTDVEAHMEIRRGTTFSGGTLIASILGHDSRLIFRGNAPAPGTHTYKLWAVADAPGLGSAHYSDRYLVALKLGGGN